MDDCERAAIEYIERYSKHEEQYLSRGREIAKDTGLRDCLRDGRKMEPFMRRVFYTLIGGAHDEANPDAAELALSAIKLARKCEDNDSKVAKYMKRALLHHWSDYTAQCCEIGDSAIAAEKLESMLTGLESEDAREIRFAVGENRRGIIGSKEAGRRVGSILTKNEFGVGDMMSFSSVFRNGDE